MQCHQNEIRSAKPHLEVVKDLGMGYFHLNCDVVYVKLNSDISFSCFLQKRTREKLVNVLSLCGQEVGLTKNPSVRST